MAADARDSFAMSLRSGARGAVVAFGLLLLGACTALVLITTILHDVSRDLAGSLESLRIAEEVELKLLLHASAQGPGARAILGAELRSETDEAARHVRTAHERSFVEEVRRSVADYLEGDAGGTRLPRAINSAQQLADVNLLQARTQEAKARRWNDVANALGVAGPLVATSTFLLVSLWWRVAVFHPLLRLGAAMREFTEGNPDARARESGTPELRRMARTFNELASALTRAKLNQLRYVAGVVHDLRTPLAAVQLAAGYASPDFPMPPEPRLREIFGMIGRQLTRLNSLVGDVLNAVRVEAGDLQLALEDCDLVELVDECVTTMARMCPSHLIQLTRPARATRVRCDRVRIEQVVNNLLDNAVKYSPAGSRVTVAVFERDDVVGVSVSDQGQGVLPEDRERIFEPFQRTSSRHEEVPGVGLGLSTAKKVVEAHGGSIEIETTSGGGATFVILLPATRTNVDG